MNIPIAEPKWRERKDGRFESYHAALEDGYYFIWDQQGLDSIELWCWDYGYPGSWCLGKGLGHILTVMLDMSPVFGQARLVGELLYIAGSRGYMKQIHEDWLK